MRACSNLEYFTDSSLQALNLMKAAVMFMPLISNHAGILRLK